MFNIQDSNIEIEVIPLKKLYDDNGRFNNGYKVYSVEVPKEYQRLVEYKGNIVVSGICPELNIGNRYSMVCSKIVQGKYEGSYKIEQMVFANLLIQEDKNKTILESLGYAEITIQNMLQAYPNICDLIVENKIHKIDISKIKNFNEKNLNNLIAKIQKNARELYLILNFQEYKFTFAIARSILNKYNKNIEKLKTSLEKDPYKTLCDIQGMGFKKADKLILECNPNLIDSKYRIISAIEHIVQENQINGSTYMPIMECYNLAKSLVPECIKQFNQILKANDRLYVDDIKKVVSLKSTYDTEKYLATKLLEGVNIKKNYDFNFKKFHKSAEGDILTEQQIEILPILEKYSISILCGYAGTGKSTSINAVTQMLKENGKDFLLIAPTGRASKVLSENTGEIAGTIHRMVLNNSMIECDFVICDEATMIDIFLMKELISRIDFNRTSLLFVCDPAQLSSVGCGNVLSDMINSNKFPLVFLDRVFRYEEGGISYIATKVRKGENYLHTGDKYNNIIKFGSNKDYLFIETPDDNIDKQIAKIYHQLIEKGRLDINEIVILSAYNSGKYGTVILNNQLQELINPKTPNNKTVFSKRIDNTNIDFRIGDKVIQIKNDYNVSLNTDDIKETVNIFNGEDGIIIDANETFLIVKFNEVETRYDKSMLSNLMLGYAITIHKSQGSTFKNVIIVSPTAHTYFSNRNLLYVATTRARNKVIHIGSINLVNSSLKKNESQIRNTFLKDLLMEV